MKPTDYKCQSCSHVFEYVAGYGEEFPEFLPCQNCGQKSIRKYSGLHSICHQGKAGNHKNGYTSNLAKVKKT